MTDGFQGDLTSRIVNVKWAGKGVFVAGRALVWHVNPCAIVYGKPEDTQINWKPLGAFGIGDGGYILGCSVGGRIKHDDGTTTGKTVFVAIGQTFEEPNYGSIILTSTDGQDWQTTYKKLDVITGFHNTRESGNGVVWDEDAGAFYAAFFGQDNATGERVFSERIYRSSDGRSWGLIEEAAFDPFVDDAAIPDSLLLKHCKKPENVGGKHPSSSAVKMPDGLQAYSKAGDVFMKPKNLIRYNALGPLYNTPAGQQPTSTVTIRRPSEDGEGYVEQDANIPDPCFAVAATGSTWVAGGGRSRLDMSNDDGKTWTSSYQHIGDPDRIDILTIVAGEPDK